MHLNDAVKIEDTVRKMVIAAATYPAAIAVATAVRRNDPEVPVSFVLQCIDESSPTVGKIEITMDKDQRFNLGGAPFETMNGQSLRTEECVTRRRHALESIDGN